MAKPIAVFSKLDDASDDAQRQLKAAPVRHAAALLAGYQTLQALHDAGALEILCSLANAQEHLIGQVSAGLNKPEAIRGLRNLLALVKLLGSIEPERLEAIVAGIGKAMQENGEHPQRAPGVWSLVQKTRSQDTRRALGTAIEVLESVGRELSSVR